MKLATLDLSPELFIEFCLASKSAGGVPRRFVVIENPLPDDAEVVGVVRVPGIPERTLRLLIRSESFNEVAEGAEPPALPLVIYQTVFDEPAKTGDKRKSV